MWNVGHTRKGCLLTLLERGNRVPYLALARFCNLFMRRQSSFLIIHSYLVLPNWPFEGTSSPPHLRGPSYMLSTDCTFCNILKLKTVSIFVW